jgi:hypothetical protein
MGAHNDVMGRTAFVAGRSSWTPRLPAQLPNELTAQPCSLMSSADDHALVEITPNRAMQGTRGTAASCFAGVISARP